MSDAQQRAIGVIVACHMNQSIASPDEIAAALAAAGLLVDDDTPRFIKRPTSCRCGGTEAWLLRIPGKGDLMVGCVCHTDLEARLRAGLAHWNPPT